MQVRIIRFLLLVVMCGLVLPGMIVAQSDDAARDVVLQAVQDTIALEGYHLNIKYYYIPKKIGEDGIVSERHSIQKVDGDVAQNGNRRLIRTVQFGDTLDEALRASLIQIEQLMFEGQLYLNFQAPATAQQTQYGLDRGWWRSEDLIMAVEDPNIRSIVREQSQVDVILETLFRDINILNVEEVEQEIIQEQLMRVFDVECDAFRLLLGSLTDTRIDEEQILIARQNLPATSEVTLNYRLWIGADDNLLYRGRGNQRTFIPYQPASNIRNEIIGIDDVATIELTISHHGETVEIRPPDPASLNE